jgi:hypothetical protein
MDDVLDAWLSNELSLSQPPPALYAEPEIVPAAAGLAAAANEAGDAVSAEDAADTAGGSAATAAAMGEDEIVEDTQPADSAAGVEMDDGVVDLDAWTVPQMVGKDEL